MTSPSSTSAWAFLVVDDEKNIRATLALCLESMGGTVIQVDNSAAALAALDRQAFDLAFVDLRLGAESGLDLLPRLLERAPELGVVMITAYGTIDTAVEAMQRGARDFMPKPFTPAQIRLRVERLIEQRNLQQKVAVLEDRLAVVEPHTDTASKSPAMAKVLDQARLAAAHDVPVLLLGESGTGKGVMAQSLHAMSPRRDHPFVVVNCPTLSEELLASELFGHAKGAFTGAIRDQAGRVESAAGGTLFLDEIGEIPPGLQAKLLRFLQDRRYERLGEPRTRVADVRVVAATNRRLEAEVQAGRFREDLFFRLNTVELALPPLRERPEDILPLAESFVRSIARALRRRPPELTQAAQEALRNYPWPGNLRELRNTLERAMIFSPGDELDVAAMPTRLIGHRPAGPVLGGEFTLEQIEREHLERVVSHAPSLEEAARILGIDSSTLYRKRRRYEDV